MILHIGTRRGLTVALLLLSLVLLLPLAAPIATAAAARAEEEVLPSVLSDFSNPDSEATVEVSASAFVALLTGETLSSAESAYLDRMLVDRPFVYGNAIAPRTVESRYTDNTLTVTLHPYQYVAVNGEQVTWYPLSATLGERSIPLSDRGEDGSKQGVLHDLPESAAARLEVQYTCTIAVPAAVADAYLNYAWNYADKLVTDHATYEAGVAAFEAYQAYLSEKAAYDISLSAWQDYLVAKAKYDKLMADYTAYEKEMAIYREGLAAYQNYQEMLVVYETRLAAYEKAYATYVEEMNAYNAALPIYETYRAQMDRIEDCLATLDSAFVRNSRGKQMYATLIGDTVATVVDNKADLVSIGKCDPKDIDKAAASTAILQDLLTQYKDLPDVPARFAFYRVHYAELRKNFIDLYGSLRSLYNNDVVKSTLISYDKLERFIEFLSQLYVLSSGLDDTQNRAEDWVIYGRYDAAYYGFIQHHYQTELEPSQLPPDKNNADPQDLVCPTEVVPKPLRPFDISYTKPVPPAEVICPVEPDAVIKPTAPAPMDEPVCPAPVEDPGEKPISPSYTAVQQELMTAYKQGTLRRREEGSTRSVSFDTTLRKQIALENTCPVEFYDADGKTLLYSAELEEMEAIVYQGDLPSRPATDKYTYRFVGWKDEDGTLFSTDALGIADAPHKVFYASYEAVLRQYTVTWMIDGTKTTASVPYGTIPTFDGTPERASTAQYDYTFVGWQIPDEDGWGHDLPPVLGDVTYEAAFEAVTRRYTVTWLYNEATGESTATLWPHGSIPTPDKTPIRADGEGYLYEFTGWDTEPSAVTGDITYTAQYNAIPILPPVAEGQKPQAPVYQDDTYSALVPAEGLQVDRLLALALQKDAVVALTSSDAVLSLHLNPAALADLSAVGCTYVQMEAVTTSRTASADGLTAQRYAIRFLNADGQEVPLRYPVTLRFNGANAYTKIFRTDTDTPIAVAFTREEEGTLAAKINGSMTLQFINECTVSTLPCENAALTADHTMATTGKLVTLLLSHSDDYHLAAMHIVGDLSGREYPLVAGETLSFIMPDEPVTIRAEVVRKTYTITFVADGNIISTQVYNKGDTVILPDDPKKAGEGNTVYTFIGWTPVITVVTGDVTYTATFRESIQGDSNSYIPTDSQNRVYLLYIELGLLLAVLILTPIVIVRMVQWHKHKKQAANREPRS